jgi:hypothetical protein
MHQLIRVDTQSTSRRHGRVGHLFHWHFKAILVECDAYPWELARCAVLHKEGKEGVKHWHLSGKSRPFCASLGRSRMGGSARPPVAASPLRERRGHARPDPARRRLMCGPDRLD